MFDLSEAPTSLTSSSVVFNVRRNSALLLDFSFCTTFSRTLPSCSQLAMISLALSH